MYLNDQFYPFSIRILIGVSIFVIIQVLETESHCNHAGPELLFNPASAIRVLG